MSCLSEETSLLNLTLGTDDGGPVAGAIFSRHSHKYKSHGKRKKETARE